MEALERPREETQVLVFIDCLLIFLESGLVSVWQGQATAWVGMFAWIFERFIAIFVGMDN